MNLLKPVTTEEEILSLLKNGPRKTTDLLVEVGKVRNITKQGFYASLRKLRASETVIVSHSLATLNVAWVKDVTAAVDQMRAAYLAMGEGLDILPIGEKESVSYSFSTTHHLDAFWGHSQSLIIARTDTVEPVYSYDPHYWFYMARHTTEKRIIDDIVKTGRQFLMTVGGKTLLDRHIQTEFSSDDLQYHMEELFTKRNYYVVVIDGYVTEVLLDPKIAAAVDAVYESGDLSTASEEKLQELLSVRARHKLRITRNKKKAAVLKAKMRKNFFVRRES